MSLSAQSILGSPEAATSHSRRPFQQLAIPLTETQEVFESVCCRQGKLGGNGWVCARHTVPGYVWLQPTALPSWSPSNPAQLTTGEGGPSHPFFSFRIPQR